MDILSSMLTLTLIYSTPIIITALGGMFSERSGVVNIALEGLMMFGAFTAATTLVLIEGLPFIGDFAPWIALLSGIIAGGVVSLLHAYLSINLKSDQVISGTAINMLATGTTIYLAQIIFGQQRTKNYETGFIKTTYDNLARIPIIGKILFDNIYPTVYVALILVFISWYVLYKTPFGLRLRATGEHPQAVDSMGISVYKMRYIGVFLSGCFGGLGGAILVLTMDTQYTVTSIHGIGFISLAALVFGRWKPAGVLGASLFFGFSQILSVYSSSISFLSNLPYEFFYALPYVLTIIALVIFSGKAVGPKAAGEAYDKGKR
jgi:simple sugar transport system permease protein